MRISALLGVVSILLLGAACSRSKDHERPPNVVLITIDALRADHLGCYGYHRNTSPNMDAFARSSTLYTRAIATSPWTLPTHASLFTGRYPFGHGAHGFLKETSDRLPNAHPLSEEEYTLAEALAERGYRTAAFIANAVYLHRWFKLNQGFETYATEIVYADILNQKILSWLHEFCDEPFFLFVNYIDVHPPYNTRFVPDLLDQPCPGDSMKVFKQLQREILPATGPLPRKQLQIAIDQHDTSIANVDRAVGALLRRLEMLGIKKNTLVVLSSDHGQYFGEHHLMGHSRDIYQPVLWVPLIIQYPGQEQGEQVDRWFSLAEIPWQILSYLFPDDPTFPQDTFPVRSDKTPVLAEIYYTRKMALFHPVWGKRFRRIRTAIFDGPFKYIHSSDGQHELYNLETDPQELNNLVEIEPERAEQFDNQLLALKSGHKAAAPVSTAPIPEEDILHKMKALGYLE